MKQCPALFGVGKISKWHCYWKTNDKILEVTISGDNGYSRAEGYALSLIKGER